MKDKTCALQLCFSHLFGNDFFKDVKDSFKKRIEVQKLVYLLQIYGVDLGYRYNWYIRGPYCSELSDDAYDICHNSDLYEKYCKRAQISTEAVAVINDFKVWLGDVHELIDGICKDSWLELLASLHFITHNVYLKEKSQETIVGHLLKCKPWYTMQQAQSAFKVLNNLGLIMNKQIT